MREGDAIIAVDGARLRVRIAGNGPAVLLLHGWALDLDMWRPQFAGLAPRYRLVAFDRRGFGSSSGTPGIDRDIADVEQILDAACVEHVAIVGMSQGARVALRCAVRFPQRVLCIVLDGAPREAGLPSGGPPEIPMADFRELAEREGIAAMRAKWLEHPLMRLHTEDAGMHALLREMVGRYPGNDLNDREPRSSAVDLDSVGTPALVINGDRDSQARRDAGVELCRALPNAQLAIVADAGHLPNLDQPIQYNRRLHEFLDEHMTVTRRNSSSQERSTHHAE